MANPPDVSIFNQYSFMIIGILFEIFGALFISMEAIGINKFTKVYRYIYIISKWSGKSKWRAFLTTGILFIPIGLGIFFKIKILLTLFLLFMCLIWLWAFLFDRPESVEKFIIKRTKEGRIGPFGFLIMICGFLLQLISVVWDMCLNI